jgi:hypothetical protein
LAKPLGLLLLIVWAPLFGQDVNAPAKPRTIVVGPPHGLQNLTVPSHPFNAEWETTTVQTLADGSTITTESTNQWARDSQGRLVNISTTISTRAEAPSISFHRILDPIARANFEWAEGSTEIKVTRWLTSEESHVTCIQASTPPSAPLPRHPPRTFPPPPGREEHEDLGARTILGVPVHGSKTTTYIPAHTVGNSGPLVLHDELWEADSSLGPMGPFTGEVLHVHDDPRSGLMTRKLVKYGHSEPDPSLFTRPADYDVEDQEPRRPQCPSGWTPATER